jgi:hypothetical protein
MGGIVTNAGRIGGMPDVPPNFADSENLADDTLSSS